jgi:hypothetical protein
MKPLVRISLLSLLMGFAVAAAHAATPAAELTVVSTKYKNLFVLKADRDFVGATVEVYYSNGDLVTAEKLGKRKIIINFCDTRLGEYTIRVVKGDKKQEFQYVKK